MWNFHKNSNFNSLNAKLNPICHLLALLGAHPILYVSRIRVNRTPHRRLLAFDLGGGNNGKY
jgi:hypothetical protein